MLTVQHREIVRTTVSMLKAHGETITRTSYPGLVSKYPHNAVDEGDSLLVHVPLGDFVLNEASDRPIALISGGVGITAVFSMLEHLAGHEAGSREVVFLRGVRSRARHSFADHVRVLARQRPGIRSVVLYKRVGPEDVRGEHYDAVVRTTAEAIRGYLPEREADFYYCGPIGFMAAEAALDGFGVPLARRHSEAFTPDPSFAAAPSVPTPRRAPLLEREQSSSGRRQDGGRGWKS